MSRRGVLNLTTQLARTLTTTAPKQQQHQLISNVRAHEAARCFKVQWSDGTAAEFSYVCMLPAQLHCKLVRYLWLRDSAPQCRPETLSELSVNVRPVSWHVERNGKELVIDWPPWTHNVSYSSQWYLYFICTPTKSTLHRLRSHVDEQGAVLKHDHHELRSVREFEWANERAKEVR